MARIRAVGKSSLITALDLGSTKVCCLIARIEAGRTRVLGMGIQRAAGIKGGFVTDTAALENVILNAVSEAEQTAGETIDSVYLNLSDASLQSQLVRTESQIGGNEISSRHIERLLERSRLAGQKRGDLEKRLPIHTFPIEYIVDFEKGLKDPRGLYSDRLAATFLSVSIDALNAKTLLSCVRRCHLKVAAYSTSSYAASLSALTAEERDSNTTLLDIGGGVTSLLMFKNGVPGHIETIPVGGNHITKDIAHALSISFGEAERLKTLYSSALPEAHGQDATIEVVSLGEQGLANKHLIAKSMLVGVVQPRLEELFELVNERIALSPMQRSASRRVTLVGGTARMQRISELASLVMEKQVKLGVPDNLVGVGEMHRGPEFAVVAGLLKFAQGAADPLSASSQFQSLDSSTKGLASRSLVARQPVKSTSRLGHWFRTYF